MLCADESSALSGPAESSSAVPLLSVANDLAGEFILVCMPLEVSTSAIGAGVAE